MHFIWQGYAWEHEQVAPRRHQGGGKLTPLPTWRWVVWLHAKNEAHPSYSTPGVGEAAGEDAEDLAGVGRGEHLDAGDPFDPFKAATTWGD